MTAQPIKGLGSEAIPEFKAIKILPTKEPAKAQKDEEREERDFSGSSA